MLSKRHPRLTYANVMVTLLAVIAFSGGTALAATVIITSNSQVAAHTIAGARAASGINKNIIPGSVGGSDLAPGTVTAANVAAANKDGTPGTPSLRTLGTGPLQAAAGNDPRLAKGVVGATKYYFNGPLPTAEVPFTVNKAGDLLLITWSGTGFRNSVQGPGVAYLQLALDGTRIESDYVSIYMNNLFEHLTFPTSESVWTGLSPGIHKFGFVGLSALVASDDQDTYFATIVEVQPNP
jgi:hypothetical protein